MTTQEDLQLSQRQIEYSYLKLLKSQHQNAEQKNQILNYQNAFQKIQSKTCKLATKNKLLEGLAEQIRQDLASEQKLQHVMKKICCKQKKEDYSYQKDPSNMSLRTQATENNMLYSKQTSIYSEAYFNSNYIDEAQQKQFLLEIKGENRALEENLIQSKKERNYYLQELEEQTDQIMDAKNYHKQLILENQELDRRIGAIQREINQLSKSGHLTNRNFVGNSSSAINTTRLNTSIVEDVSNSVKAVKNFLKSKLMVWRQQEINTERESTNNVLAEIDQ